MFLHASLFALSVPCFFSTSHPQWSGASAHGCTCCAPKSFIPSSVLLFVRPFLCPTVRSLSHRCFSPPCLRPSVPLSVRAYVRSFLCPSVPLFVCPFLCPSDHPFLCPVLSSVRPCVRPSVHLSVRPSVGPTLCSFIDSMHRSFVHCNSCVPIQLLVR